MDDWPGAARSLGTAVGEPTIGSVVLYKYFVVLRTVGATYRLHPLSASQLINCHFVLFCPHLMARRQPSQESSSTMIVFWPLRHVRLGRLVAMALDATFLSRSRNEYIRALSTSMEQRWSSWGEGADLD